MSHAPPELDMEMASCTEEPKEPVNKPKTAWTPKKVPAAKGDKITSQLSRLGGQAFRRVQWCYGCTQYPPRKAVHLYIYNIHMKAK